MKKVQQFTKAKGRFIDRQLSILSINKTRLQSTFVDSNSQLQPESKVKLLVMN